MKTTVVIAWPGLPYYAVRVLKYALDQNAYKIRILTDKFYQNQNDLDKELGAEPVIVDLTRRYTWLETGLQPPDIMYVTSWSHKAFQTLAIEAKRCFGTKVVCMTDNIWYNSWRQNIGKIYFRLHLRRLYDAYFVPGNGTIEFLRKMGESRKPIFTGYYTADDQVFSASPERERLGTIFVGQLIYRKGVDILCDAAKICEIARKIEVCGEGKYKTKCESVGLTVNGFCQPRELAQKYKGAKALILPSRLDHWGVVVHEAALSGCLVITGPRVGAHCDLVEHLVNGYILKNLTPRDITHALDWVENLSSDELRTAGRISQLKASTLSVPLWYKKFAIINKLLSNPPL